MDSFLSLVILKVCPTKTGALSSNRNTRAIKYADQLQAMLLRSAIIGGPMTESTKTLASFDSLNAAPLEDQFHGAAIVDENGNETPITEAMVQRACNALSNAWKTPSSKHHSIELMARAV